MLNTPDLNIICPHFQAEFLNNGSMTALLMSYQSIPYHSPGIGTSLITNALLRYATNSSLYSISTTNRPLPPDQTVSYTSAMFFISSYSLMPCSLLETPLNLYTSMHGTLHIDHVGL